MKKLLFCFAILFLGAVTAHAQLPVNTKAPLQDLSGISTGIVSKLTSALSLTDVQKTKVSTQINNYITQKATVSTTQDTNPTAYTKKIASMQHGLFAKLKTILTATQYAQFLGLKPPSNDVTNVLSQLFY